jgi:hypothetical protein
MSHNLKVYITYFQRDAFQLFEESDDLSLLKFNLLRDELKLRWGQRLELASIG